MARMKMLTKEIIKKLPKLREQDGKGKDAIVHAKFFNPCGAETWYVLEGEEVGSGDWRFFAYLAFTDGREGEYGYFMLSELMDVRLRFGLRIERDLYFTRQTLGECLK